MNMTTLPGLRWRGSRQNPPATPALPRSGHVTTCSGTAAWSCCPPRARARLNVAPRAPTGLPPLIIVGGVAYQRAPAQGQPRAGVEPAPACATLP